MPIISSECWFGYWLCAVRQQVINWANVEPDLCRHMASLAHNEVTHLYLEQTGGDSADNTFRRIFSNENLLILLPFFLWYSVEFIRLGQNCLNNGLASTQYGWVGIKIVWYKWYMSTVTCLILYHALLTVCWEKFGDTLNELKWVLFFKHILYHRALLICFKGIKSFAVSEEN